MSTKHKPSFDAGATKRIFNEDMGDVLNAEVTAPPRPEDQEMRVDVTLDDFDPYEHNPRLTPNEKYDEIKASIREVGLDTEFVLTKRHPSDPKFIERNGGGTRYKICRELWEETGDEKFYRHNCKFRPWTDELGVLISHGIENDTRAPLIWIENALHVDRILQYMVEQDANVKSLSVRDKAALITSNGWTITHTNLIYYAFTVETLLPVIRQSLLSGLGRRKVVALKNLQSTYRKYVATQNPEQELAFETTYRNALAKHNGDEELDVNAFEATLLEHIAQLLQCTVDDIRFNQASAQLVATGRGEPAVDDRVVSRKPETSPPLDESPPTESRGTGAPVQNDTQDNPKSAASDAGTSSPVTNKSEPSPSADASEINARLTTLRGKTQSLTLELLRDHQELITSYETSEDSKYFLGFVLTEPPVFNLPAEWLTGVVYWRLYHAFIAAMRTEKAAGYLNDIHADDLLELESQCDIPAVAQSESFEQGQAFEFQWRWNDLLIRHGAGLCNEMEERAVTRLSMLDQSLLDHGQLVLQLRHATGEVLSYGQR